MSKIDYPKARRDETAVDVYHGVEIKDPYRWLENLDSEETKAFVDAQNAISTPFVNDCPQRQAINDSLTRIWNFPTHSSPEKKGGKYYYFMNTGLQNQDVYYVQDTLEAEPKVFLDPNTLSNDGTVALVDNRWSEDGSIMAYFLSASGSDRHTIHFINAETGTKYPEVLENVRFSRVSWTHDNKGVFYSCYLDKTESQSGLETAGINNQKLFYHRIGTAQSEDVLVVEFPDNPRWRINGKVTDCGRWLIVLANEIYTKNAMYFTKLPTDMEIRGKLELTEVIATPEAHYVYVANVGTKAIFQTSKNASNYKLVTIDLENFEKNNWSELIAEHPRNVLHWASAVDGDKLAVCYTEDVKDILKVYSATTGQLLKQIPIADSATIGDFSGDKKSSQIFYGLESFLIPELIYTVDLKTEEAPKVFREAKVTGFDASLYKTTQIFYPSKDGTQVPMFIVAKKNVVLDGSSPCLLIGYGGFNASMQPSFSRYRAAFMQHLDGILAIPNIRGGGEYGEKWHAVGCVHNKQNVFDDFQFAARYLIENRYTSAKKIIIQGASNGGLLVAACINQRPDLFGAAIVEVGLTDMLKYHKFTIANSWISEYGSSDDAEQFRTLLKYSPLHNVKPPKDGGQYPATLLLTADHDDRVVPLHSLKLIATLQHEIGRLTQQTNPLLVIIEGKAGHGYGKPTSKTIEENTNILSFIVRTLNLEFK